MVQFQGFFVIFLFSKAEGEHISQDESESGISCFGFVFDLIDNRANKLLRTVLVHGHTISLEETECVVECPTDIPHLVGYPETILTEALVPIESRAAKGVFLAPVDPLIR
ncbi:hypothetical protein SDC9_125045 [bioreactor metagenome]|uniref:Uncharacterized protein n=1 Tax=bioreactor metagenome TaxID=1076179 RepID=A0A645CMA6_9ZZZZ